jgi:hypothetical protein
MPRHDADIYDYLATSKVSEVTVAQLEQSLENSFINKTNIEFWKGAITVHRLLEVSRTYPWGLPIPEQGTVQASGAQDAGGSYLFQPSGTELWQVVGAIGYGIGGTAVVDLYWTDGTTDVLMVNDKSLASSGAMMDLNDKVSAPMILSNSLFLKIVEDGSNQFNMVLAYHKVSV